MVRVLVIGFANAHTRTATNHSIILELQRVSNL